MTAVEWLIKEVRNSIQGMSIIVKEDIFKQAKEIEKNSYICSKCKSQINGKEIVQQMQDSEKSD